MDASVASRLPPSDVAAPRALGKQNSEIAQADAVSQVKDSAAGQLGEHRQLREEKKPALADAKYNRGFVSLPNSNDLVYMVTRTITNEVVLQLPVSAGGRAYQHQQQLADSQRTAPGSQDIIA